MTRMNIYLTYLLVLCTIIGGRTDSVVTDEDYLEQFMDQEAAKDADHCHLADDLSNRVDSLLNKLDTALDGENGKKLASGLKEATQLGELLEESEKSEVPELKRRLSVKSNGLADILDISDDANAEKHIVFAKREVDTESLKANVNNQIKRMPEEGEALLRAADELATLESKHEKLDLENSMSNVSRRPFNPIMGLLRATKSIARIGLQVLDRFQTSFEFLTSLPIIGKELKKIKAAGEPFFIVIDTLRHAHYLLKLSGHLQKADGIKAVFDQKRVIEAKSMLSDIGAKALRSIVHKTLLVVTKRDIKEEYTEEFVSRAFYAALSAVISQGSSCTSDE